MKIATMLNFRWIPRFSFGWKHTATQSRRLLMVRVGYVLYAFPLWRI